IRDFHVTGVQTCALPILEDIGQTDHLMQMDFSKGKITVYYTTSESEDEEKSLVLNLGGHRVSLVKNQLSSDYQNALASSDPIQRSEERRVGKECRSWWSS